MGKEEIRIIEIKKKKDAKLLSDENIEQINSLLCDGGFAPLGRLAATQKELRKIVLEDAKTSPCLVALKGKKAVGLLYYQVPPRQQIDTDVIVVAKTERHKGLATLLENRLYNIAAETGKKQIIHSIHSEQGRGLIKSLGTTRVPRLYGTAPITKVVPAPKIPPCKGFMSAASFMRLRGRMETHKKRGRK